MKDGMDRYRALCAADGELPLFYQDWWLDAACGPGNWGVALAEKGGQIVGALPYRIKPRRGGVELVLPPLTQTLGAWIWYPKNQAQKYATRLTYEKDVCESLIGDLPPFLRFELNFHYSFTNWLPFHWAGYLQTTRYTYLLDHLGDLDAIFEGFQSNIKTDIRKAQKTLSLQSDGDISRFYALNTMTFARQGIPVPYSLEFVSRLDAACAARDARRIFYAVDGEGRAHGAVYIVWNRGSAYYLMSGSDPALRNSGAISFLIWEAIRFSATVTRKFDFEGSMMEPVERFARGFGARQAPYFRIYKTESAVLRLSECVQYILKRRWR